MNIKKKVFSVVLSAVMLLSVAGVSTASAAISKKVGGGIWSYSLDPGRTVTSQYYHATRQHGSSASVGSGKIDRWIIVNKVDKKRWKINKKINVQLDWVINHCYGNEV